MNIQNTLIPLASFVAALGLPPAVWLLRKRNSNQSAEPPSEAPVPGLPPPCAGALARLDFGQSMDPVLFAQTVEGDALAHAGTHISALSADGAYLTLQALGQWCAGSEMMVAASQTGAEAMNASKYLLMRRGASGRRMPVVVHAGNRPAEEITMEVSLARKAPRGAAAIAVSLARIISAAEIADTRNGRIAGCTCHSPIATSTNWVGPT